MLLSFPLSAARWKAALGLREPKLVPLCFKNSDLIQNLREFLIKMTVFFPLITIHICFRYAIEAAAFSFLSASSASSGKKRQSIISPTDQSHQQRRHTLSFSPASAPVSLLPTAISGLPPEPND